MLAQIPTRKFQEWRAYADLEPFDERRGDLRAAQVVQAIRNAFRGKGRPGVPLQDCVLHFIDQDPPAAARTPAQAREQVKRALDVIVAIFNAPKKPRAKAKG